MVGKAGDDVPVQIHRVHLDMRDGVQQGNAPRRTARAAA